MHVTTALWLTPSGRQIEQVGLTPDIVIGNTEDPGDEQLQRAVSFLVLE